MILHDLHLNPKRQAHIYATGLLAILTLGTFAVIAVCLVALWAVVELATLLIQSIFECLNTIGQLYSTSDPLIKFCVLLAIGYAMYRLVRFLLLRRA